MHTVRWALFFSFRFFSPFYSFFLFFNFHVPFNININALWMGVCCDNINSKEKLKNRVYVLFLSRVLENHGLCEWVNEGTRWKRKKNSNCKLSAWLFLYVTESFFFHSECFFFRIAQMALVWFGLKHARDFTFLFRTSVCLRFFLLNNICWIFLGFFSLAVVCASIRLAFSSFHSGMLYTSTPTQSKIEENKIKWMNEVRTKENPETHK